MALQTVYFKEHEDHNQSIGQLSAAVSTAPWWSSLVSQPLSGEACGQLKTLSFENLITNADVTATKQLFEQDICKDYGDGQKAPAISLQSPVPEYRAGRFEIGFSQPMICAKYPYVDQRYGIFQTYGPQTSGRIMLPLSLSTDDGPIYVNPKQYNGILRRRKSRAKAAMINRLTRARKPYMHESRHLHAMRRPRGCGGRFLNTKVDPKKGAESEKKGTKETKVSSTGSQGSEVLQSNSGSKEADGRCSSNFLSEVTSLYSNRGGDLNLFQINHFRPSLHSFSDIMDSGHGLHVMPNNWVGVTDSCGNFRT